MARGPVQMQGRGGAAAGEVGNRAQYMRPALDNQNSRMLAKAFSQINSSLGRIASNEARLAERRRNDEYKDAMEYQEQQNEMAQQFGALAAVTGEDYTDQFFNNPANMMAYNESNIIGGIDRDLAGFMMNMETGENYGNPHGREQFQSDWTDYVANTLENTPQELRGEVAQRLSKAGVQMMVKSDALAVQRANEERLHNTTAAVRRSFLVSENETELAGELLFERENLAKTMGNERGNAMWLNAMTQDIENLAYQVSPEQAQKSLDQMYMLLSNEDFTKQFGTGEGSAIQEIADSLHKAQVQVNRQVSALQAQAEAEHEAAGMDLMKKAMRDRMNLNDYRDDFIAHYGMDGKKKFEEMVEMLNFTDGTVFMDHSSSNARIVSAQNLRELKNEMDSAPMTRDELQNFLTSRRGMLTQDDYEKLLNYEAKVPEAMNHPMVKAAMADTGAMADFATMVMGTNIDSITPGGETSSSVIKRAYESFVRDYNEQNAEAFTEAQRNGTVSQYMNNMMNDAAAYILDYNFTGEENPKTLRDYMNEKIMEGDSAINLSNNVAFQRYFANEELIKIIEEQAAFAEEASGADDLDFSRVDSAIGLTLSDDGRAGIGRAEDLTTEPAMDRTGPVVRDGQQNVPTEIQEPVQPVGPAAARLRQAIADDDGDGIINAREEIIGSERRRSGFVRNDNQSFEGENVRVISQSRDELSAAERKSTPGNRIISLDFNDATNKSAKGVEIVIPEDASPEERQASQEYVDAVEAFFKSHGHDSYPNRGVKTRKEVGSGKRGYYHTEPFFIADAQAVEIIKNNPEEYAHILATTLGKIGGARFIAPHEKNAQGAQGSIGSERQYALDNILPYLEKYMGDT